MAQVFRPQRRADPLGKLSAIGSIVGAVASGGSTAGSVPGALKTLKGESPNAQAPQGAIARRAAGQTPDLTDNDIAEGLKAGEKALNEVRASDPETAKQFEQPIYDAILEADKRFKTHGTFRPQGSRA